VLKGSVQETLEDVIGSTMNEELRFHRKRERQKDGRMVNLTMHILHTVLRHIVKNTVVACGYLFSLFLESFNWRPSQLAIALRSDESALVFVPSIDTFREQLISLLLQLETTIPKWPVISVPMFEVTATTVSFSDCVDAVVQARDALEELFAELRNSQSQPCARTFRITLSVISKAVSIISETISSFDSHFL
jgi:hypothetical protein